MLCMLWQCDRHHRKIYLYLVHKIYYLYTINFYFTKVNQLTSRDYRRAKDGLELAG